MPFIFRQLLRTNQNVFKFSNPTRTVYVMAREKGRRPRTKRVLKNTPNDKLQKWADQDDLRKAREHEIEYEMKISHLKTLTSSMASYVRHTYNGSPSQDLTFRSSIEQTPEHNTGRQENITNDNEEDSANGNKKEFKPDKISINTPAMDLPSIVADRLGPASRYLVRKDAQSWNLVMYHLQSNGGFSGLRSKDVAKLVRAMPGSQITAVFPLVESLMKEADICKTSEIANSYLKKLVSVPKIDDQRLSLIEETVHELKAKSKKGRLNTETYELLVEAYGKTNNIAKLEEVISDMKKFELTLSSKVYSSILATSVYKTKDHRQVVQLFDQMKFLAGCMAPNTREYRDVIVSYINNDDVEKALDLYQEMNDNKIEVDQQVLVALARGCISRPQLKLKAWDFIFEIYEKGMKPTVGTLEYMLYLAARDGDLSLSRALYQQLIKLNSNSPRSLGFLLLAYSNATVDSEEFTVPTIIAHETGRRFRQNILEKVSFDLVIEDPFKAVPFLPKVVLTSQQEVLSESSAIMAHALLVNRGALSDHNVNTFLNIAANLGSLDEFKDRFEQFTLLDMTGVPQTRVHVDEERNDKHRPEEFPLETIVEEEKSYISESQSSIVSKSPILQVPIENTVGIKIPRSTYTYTIALKAAARHKNYEFAEQIWKERGLLRKTIAFTSLSRREKDALDFIFATTMVHCLTEMNLLDDALAILISTEYQFKWTWKELSPLYKAAVEVGHSKVTRTVRGIARRAQIKFEGKIRRKDFKLYVMQNKR